MIHLTQARYCLKTAQISVVVERLIHTIINVRCQWRNLLFSSFLMEFYFRNLLATNHVFREGPCLYKSVYILVWCVSYYCRKIFGQLVDDRSLELYFGERKRIHLVPTAGARLNYVEKLLHWRDVGGALAKAGESEVVTHITFRKLYQRVWVKVAALRMKGLKVWRRRQSFWYGLVWILFYWIFFAYYPLASQLFLPSSRNSPHHSCNFATGWQVMVTCHAE